uniref:DUF834 domain-containing protein n=1 Tax=Oryza rufipogon TaxID=4529 RepID=A0A0E0PW11_ORYRU
MDVVARVCGGKVVSVVDWGSRWTTCGVEQCCGGSSDGRRQPALTKAMAARVGSGGGSPVVDWGSVVVDDVRRGVVMPTAWVARRGGGASSDEVRLEATNGSAASGAR